ncbi:hypothetical protein CIB93_14075 [Streptomyces sp. WZ.A104]|uniref:DUF6415 family natural product biosynthesis protein n=1 Tax=Streptomyces sp. WZ.A104 TaxID=2023771 RepID=UPI000BBBD159|nr:DUF6415 family natural product biosynthesis protein [Streptomyces sp. WZ.A104]PCG85477.1 hypothetical protein CIB93_14075 [Streptomyces sp. WZ.A104]
MNAVATSPRWTHSQVPLWEPPLDADSLAGVLDRLRSWTPLDGDALLDDVATALDDVPPAEAEAVRLTARLQGQLAQLLDIAVAAESGRRDGYVATLVQRARELAREAPCGMPSERVPHLRQVAWVAGELLDRLAARRELKTVA